LLSGSAGCTPSLRASPRASPASTPDLVELHRMLDAFHHAASVADEEAYFAVFLDDAVFLGTDATERWSKAEFEAWAMPYFQRESAWTYTPSDRFAALAPCGMVAWFDERLSNDQYGELRGTGVARLTDQGWRLAQYSLTFLVPNERAKEVVGVIRSESPTPAPGGDP